MIAILIDAFVKSTVVLLLAAAVTLLLRRSPAALRHLVWALACGGVLALPLASALLPNVRLAGWPRLDVPVSFDAQPMQDQRRPAAPAAVAAPTSRGADPTPSASSEADPVRWR